MSNDKNNSESKDDVEKAESVPVLSEKVVVVIGSSEQEVWQETQTIHELDDDASATHLAINSEQLDKLKGEGLAEKFEIVDSESESLTDDVSESFVQGLKSINLSASDAEEAQQLQGKFSIEYMMKKFQNLKAAKPLQAEPLELNQFKESKEANLPSGIEIAKHAKALGELHRDWWRNEGINEEVRKCNLYGDRVYRDMKVPLPWTGKAIPNVHGMKAALLKSNDWEVVYTDKKPFDTYKAHSGDFVIWDKKILDMSLHHCGVVGGSGEIMYAGSGFDHGYTESNFKDMVGAPSYGRPSFIFRSKHLR